MIEQYIPAFWRQVFKDSLFIQHLLLGTEDSYSQLDADLTVLNNSLSRYTIEPFRKLIWMFVTYDQTDLNQDAMTFNQENIYFDGTKRFGESTHNFFTLPIPENIKSIPFILSSPVEPEIVLQDQIDYYLDTTQNIILFRENPFSKGFQQRFIQTGGEPLLGIAMWFYRSNQDFQDIPKIYAEPVRVGAESSEYFKRVVNAIWDLRVEGGTITNVNKLLAAAVDTDAITVAGELKSVFTEGSRVWAEVGDKLYSAPTGSTVLKSVGDQVLKGELLFDTAKVYTGRDTIPFSEFPALHLSDKFIDSSFKGGVMVENKDYPFPEERSLILSSTSDGKVLVLDELDPDLSYLINVQIGFDIELLVTQLAGTDYKQVTTRCMGLPFKGRDDTVEDFRLYLLSIAALTGHDLTERIIEDNQGKPPATINLFKEYQSRTFANNAFFVYINSGAIPDGVDVGMFLSYIKFTIPAYTTIFTYLQDSASEGYSTDNIVDGVEVFDVVDLDSSYSASNVTDAVNSKTSI